MHLSFASLWVDPPWGTYGNPGEMVQFWYFFFPHGEGDLFSFGNYVTGPLGHTHGICLSFGQQNISLDYSFFASFYFISMPNFDIMLCVCSYFPVGKGYLSLILCPLPRGFEWSLFITKKNSPAVDPRGSK